MDRTAQRLRDEWLALRCQSGEPGAFADLVREMERPLLYYAAKLVNDESAALDVLQAVWMSALRTIRRLDDPSALRPWLYRLTHGHAIDRIRGDRARERAEQERAESATEAVEDDNYAGADAAALHRALDQIDVRHREVLVLHFLEDLSVAEVASVVGCPPGTVKSRIHHAKRALRQVLEERDR